MARESTIMVYPFPDKTTEWQESMREACQKEFLTEAELTACLEQGGVTIDLLAQIHGKIVQYSSFNMIMTMAHWRKIKQNLNLSDDDWFRFNL